MAEPGHWSSTSRGASRARSVLRRHLTIAFLGPQVLHGCLEQLKHIFGGVANLDPLLDTGLLEFRASVVRQLILLSAPGPCSCPRVPA